MKIKTENIKFKKFDENNLDDVCRIQQNMVDTLKEDQKGFYLPDTREYCEKILNEENNLGWIWGAYYNDKIVGYIYLSISPNVKELADRVPNLKGTYADIDGVIVCPEYRGNGIQLLMLDFIEEKAKERNIKNLLGEITKGNVWSLNNFLKKNYTIANSYKKLGYIERDIMHKEI